jgi:SNF2 family DNA or RNA helicase
MLDRKDLHHYQEDALEFIKEKKRCSLMLDMGLGKTTTSLTASSCFLDDFFINKTLVIAPLRVANTVWKQEAEKWKHLLGLRVVVCTGSAAERRQRVNSDADIYVINAENVQWLVDTVKSKWKWDMLIIDEASKFKNPRAKRFRALKKILKYTKSIVELTGTPSPNGYMDLWSQIYLLDQGERLGRTITSYRQRFFDQDGYRGYSYKLKPGAEEEIKELIKDICITMKSEDYLELPDRINITQYIEFPKDISKKYKEFEKEFVLELTEKDITSPSTATLTNKLLQICNGAIYDEDKNVHILHDEKIQALKDIIEDNPTENILVAYNYKSDLERLKKAFPKAVTLSKEGTELEEWNKGNISMLLAHPMSAGHGINAQYGGSVIIWFGLTWSLEHYQQFNARLHRQGQTKPVRIIHIVAQNAMDERVLKALNSKAKTQEELMKYLKHEIKCKI